MSILKPFVLLLLAISIAACNNSDKSAHDQVDTNHLSDSIRLWMKDVNAYYFATLLPDGKMIVVTSGKDTAGKAVDGNTIFEGASLSKTITAYTYWKMNKSSWVSSNMKIELDNGSCQINPLHLLQHRIKTDRKDASICVPGEFEYSEENYLMLQKDMENMSQSNLEALGQQYVFGPLNMQSSGFLWQKPQAYVNGFVENEKLHRYIYQYEEPFSNGSLYTSGNDLVKFAEELMNGQFTEFIDDSLVSVKGFPALYWGLGMGVEKSENGTVFWQWGSSWAFNNLLMVNPEKKTFTVALSNSLIGAKRLRETCNKLNNNGFTLFNYINWY